MIEIERKFLVLNENYKSEAFSIKEISQGYLNTNPNRTVRIRIKENKGFLTIKGIGNASGMTRFEWEKEILILEARALLNLCEAGTISKIRYEVIHENHLFEIDEFLGENQGLVLAEIELVSEEEDFEKPKWIGKEVTNDQRYYNSYLSNHPYQKW